MVYCCYGSAEWTMQEVGIQMNFEVNGVRYFLTFSAEEGEWLLLTPVKNGMRRLRIHNDGVPVVPMVDIGFEPGDQHSLS